MCCAVQLGYRAIKGEYGEGVQKGLAQNDSGAQRGRRTGISRMEFGLAASRCIQIVFFPPLPPQDNFRPIFDFASRWGSARKNDRGWYQASFHRRHILPLRVPGKIMRKRNTIRNWKNFPTRARCDFSLFKGKFIGKICELQSLRKPDIVYCNNLDEYEIE